MEMSTKDTVRADQWLTMNYTTASTLLGLIYANQQNPEQLAWDLTMLSDQVNNGSEVSKVKLFSHIHVPYTMFFGDTLDDTGLFVFIKPDIEDNVVYLHIVGKPMRKMIIA